MKQIIKSSFFQLLVIYVILVALVSFELLFKYTLHFEIFAVLLGLFALVLTKEKEVKINKLWLILPLILILVIRILPYLNNSVPLGYDPGIYKYAFEGFTDNWVYLTFPLGFLTLIGVLKNIFTIEQLLIPFFMFITLLLGFMIYATAKRFFNENVAILSTIVYSLSIVQFKVFSYFYYKNSIALILILLAFYLIEINSLLFIPVAAFLGGFHRPTFLIFGLTFLMYTLINKNKVKNIIYGCSILLLTIPFYLSNFKELILNQIEPLVTANIGAGTFITFFQYQFSTLIYLPFALIGFIYLIKEKKFNLIFLSTLILLVIVYFQLVFFNRFLVHLDIFLIILAGYGFYLILQNNKRLGLILIGLLIISGVFISLKQDKTPLISEEELEIISTLENNSYVLVTDSRYSPWVLGYSKSKTIAPGLFDYNIWDYEEWTKFWNAKPEESVEMLKVFEKPLYIFIGRNQRQNLNTFNSTCFNKVLEQNRTYIYRFEC